MLDIFNRTHQILASGKVALQKNNYFNILKASAAKVIPLSRQKWHLSCQCQCQGYFFHFQVKSEASRRRKSETWFESHLGRETPWNKNEKYRLFRFPVSETKNNYFFLSLDGVGFNLLEQKWTLRVVRPGLGQGCYVALITNVCL